MTASEGAKVQYLNSTHSHFSWLKCFLFRQLPMFSPQVKRKQWTGSHKTLASRVLTPFQTCAAVTYVQALDLWLVCEILQCRLSVVVWLQVPSSELQPWVSLNQRNREDLCLMSAQHGFCFRSALNTVAAATLLASLYICCIHKCYSSNSSNYSCQPEKPESTDRFSLPSSFPLLTFECVLCARYSSGR